ncbi:MAG: hypothetical protein LAP21_12515 [Acidobacteriia bacterium]|nr:hypothetical protein [Terriglobia bacterium]
MHVRAAALMLAEGKLVESAWLKRRMDEQARLRIDGMASGLLLATMGGACVALNIGAWMAGEYQGVRLGTVTRADHPFWFWTIAAIFFPSSIAVVGWGLLEFVRALKQAKK